jgi:hypothetical protein
VIQQARPHYESEPIAGVDINIEEFAFDSTAVSLSIKLFTGK